MGLKLGRALKKVFRAVPKVIGLGATFAAGGLPALATRALTGGTLTRADVGAGVPSIQAVTGVAPFFAQPVIQANGGMAVPAAAGGLAALGFAGIRFMTRNAAMAIMKLAQIFGISVALPTLARVGRRLWGTMIAFARRHPAISVLSMLTALGLSVEEASEFMLWGETTKRRRRGRGISARDIRTCRRTMRRMAAFQRDMFRSAPRRRALGRGAGAPIIAQN